MRLFISVLLCFQCLFSIAQGFEIGHTAINFSDESRNRDIPAEIYYPADEDGEDVLISDGEFPVISLGHGFLMGADAYANFWQELVPQGYIICIPTTETGFSPNHEELAMDLIFVIQAIQDLSMDELSIFYEAVAIESAIMGHSMGGGASILAGSSDESITTLVNFAAAETSPSAIAAAENVLSPTLIFSGLDDCVAPPGENQNPIYEAINGICKTQINIIQGGHCYFANENTACDFGENFCNPNLNITRNEQQSITFNFLNLWLSFWLYSDDTAWAEFSSELEVNNAITYHQDFCESLSSLDHISIKEAMIYPNPASDYIIIDGPRDYQKVQFRDLSGRLISTHSSLNSPDKIDISHLPKGIYTVHFSGSFTIMSQKIIIQ